MIARRSSLEILILSPGSKFGGPECSSWEDGRKKVKKEMSRGQILPSKNGHFFTFLKMFKTGNIDQHISP